MVTPGTEGRTATIIVVVCERAVKRIRVQPTTGRFRSLFGCSERRTNVVNNALRVDLDEYLWPYHKGDAAAGRA